MILNSLLLLAKNFTDRCFEHYVLSLFFEARVFRSLFLVPFFVERTEYIYYAANARTHTACVVVSVVQSFYDVWIFIC